MSQHRKRQPRSVEHQEAAEQERWEQGVEFGTARGREEMAFELGQKLGFAQGFAQGQCMGYDAGYRDKEAGKPRAHRPHDAPDTVNDLMDGNAHE